MVKKPNKKSLRMLYKDNTKRPPIYKLTAIAGDFGTLDLQKYKPIGITLLPVGEVVKEDWETLHLAKNFLDTYNYPFFPLREEGEEKKSIELEEAKENIVKAVRTEMERLVREIEGAKEEEEIEELKKKVKKYSKEITKLKKKGKFKKARTFVKKRDNTEKELMEEYDLDSEEVLQLETEE